MDARQIELFRTHQETAIQAEFYRHRVLLRGLQMRAGDVDVVMLGKTRYAIDSGQFSGEDLSSLWVTEGLLTTAHEGHVSDRDRLLRQHFISAVKTIDENAIDFRQGLAAGGTRYDNLDETLFEGIQPYYQPGATATEAALYMRSVMELSLATGRLVRNPDIAQAMAASGVGPFDGKLRPTQEEVEVFVEHPSAPLSPRDVLVKFQSAHNIRMDEWDQIRRWSMVAISRVVRVVGTEGVDAPVRNEALAEAVLREQAPIKAVDAGFDR